MAQAFSHDHFLTLHALALFGTRLRQDSAPSRVILRRLPAAKTIVIHEIQVFTANGAWREYTDVNS